jgi:hypothetical protein
MPLDLSHRTRLLFQSLGLNPEEVRDRMEKQTLWIVVEPEWAIRRPGQVLIFMLLNLLLRWAEFLPRTRVSIPKVELILQNPLLQGNTLRSALKGLAESLGQGDRASFIPSPPAKTPDLTMIIGTPPPEGSRSRRRLYVAGAGWRGCVARSPLAETLPTQDPNPIGPCLSAVLATSQLFNLLLHPYLKGRPDFTLAERVLFNAFTYDRVERPNPALPHAGALDLDLVLVGAGGLGSVALFVLSLVEDLRGSITIIEGDRLEAHNLNRLLTATLKDVGPQGSGANKAALAAEYLRRTTDLRTEVRPWAYQRAQHKEGESRGEEVLAILTVDDTEARLSVAQDFKEVLVGGYARFSALVGWASRVSGCLGCWERAGLLGSALQATPSISHVTALPGVLLAAEVLKRRLFRGSQLLNAERNLFITVTGLPPGPGGLLQGPSIADCPLCHGNRPF